MSDEWLTKWGGVSGKLLDKFGEPLTWRPAGSNAVSIRGIVRREVRGEFESSDGKSVGATGAITIRMSDVPTANVFDTVSIAKSRGSAVMELWVVESQQRDHGNGFTTFEIRRESEREYSRSGMERR